MMKCAIIYICSGGYEVFWPEFYQSSEEYFLPDTQKDYFVFTDGKKVLGQTQPHVKVFYCKQMGWPYDALEKWSDICRVQDLLTSYDLITLCNANTQFLNDFGEQHFTKAPLTVWSTTKEGESAQNMPLERRKQSKAYVPYEADTKKYFCSGFVVGETKLFLQMARELRDWTEEDLRHGIIARCHDESMLNAYLYRHGDLKYACIDGTDILPEEFVKADQPPHAVFRNKDRYGGNIGVRYNPTLGKLDIVRRKVMHKIKNIFSR